MKKQLRRWLLLISLTTTLAKDGELPLCPSNMQFFPQNLPMHCRMPKPGEFQLPELPRMPTMPPLTQFLQNLRPDKQSIPLPMPVPPYPGMPGQMPMPMPMPMPMMPGVPPHKLPVIVMPFYSPDPSSKQPGFRRPGSKGKRKKKPFFKKPPRYDSDTDTSSDMDTDTDSDTSSDTSERSSERGWWKGQRRNSRRHAKKHKLKRRGHKNTELLTPILQYVTKDGYVIFEKKITKHEAKDWLKPIKETGAETGDAADENKSSENTDNVDNKEHEDPKTDAEELKLKEKEKSNEERMESAPQKKKKHRQSKPNTLMNQHETPSP